MYRLVYCQNSKTIGHVPKISPPCEIAPIYGKPPKIHIYVGNPGMYPGWPLMTTDPIMLFRVVQVWGGDHESVAIQCSTSFIRPSYIYKEVRQKRGWP